jgi:hypothetical protein
MSLSSDKLRFEKQEKAFLRGDLKTVRELAEEARTELRSQGWVKAGPLGWFKQEWISYGIKIGAIIRNGNNYSLVMEETEKEIVDGYRGRKPIITKKKSRDISIIKQFFEYCKSQQCQNSLDDDRLKSLIQQSLM